MYVRCLTCAGGTISAQLRRRYIVNAQVVHRRRERLNRPNVNARRLAVVVLKTPSRAEKPRVTREVAERTSDAELEERLYWGPVEAERRPVLVLTGFICTRSCDDPA